MPTVLYSTDDEGWHRSLPRVLSELGVGLVVGKPDQAVAINDAFCDLTGYAADEILGVRPVLDLFASDARDMILRRVDAPGADNSDPARLETEVRHRDGRRVPVEMSARVARREGQTIFVATFRDLTGHKRAAAELASRSRMQEAVADLGREALVERRPASLLDAAVHAVARILGVEYVRVLELLPGREAFLLRAGVGWDDGLVEHAIVPFGPACPSASTLASEAPVVIEDIGREAHVRLSPFLVDHGVVASATVVIRGDGRPYGVLGADSSLPRQFTADDVLFLRSVANVLADAFARSGVESDLTTRARQQAAVAELGRRALAESDLSVLFEAAVHVVAETLGAEFVKVLELLPGGDALLLRAGSGWPEGMVGTATIGAGLDSQAGFTLASDAPIVVEDLARERRFRRPPLLLRHGVVSGLSVIILGREGPWGVLGAHTTTQRRFSTDDVNFLQAVANVLAEAIRRGQIEEALRSGHDRERHLRERLESHSRMVVEAQEGERRRIARELHDEIGQALTGLKLALENLDGLAPGAASERLARAQDLTSDLVRQVHDMSLDLRPSILDDLGLRPALIWLLERYGAQTGVEVGFRCSGLQQRLRPEVETAAYRIVQEALTNVARHAGVKQAAVDCSVRGASLRVHVDDHGIGFDVGAVPVGRSSGLAGMEERARSTGGWLRVRSQIGVGTTVVAEFPITTACSSR